MPSRTILRARVEFLDPTVDGQSISQVTEFYRPLMDVHGDELTSCFFEKIGDGEGVIKLGVLYEVLIRLSMRPQIEQYYGKPMKELFPPGRPLKLIAVPDIVLGRGVVAEVIEVGSCID